MQIKDSVAEIRNTGWFDLLCMSAHKPGVQIGGQPLPLFPPPSLQVKTTGASGAETLREAFIFYEDCLKTFAELGRPLQSDSRLLDFGTGWGRIARCFLHDMPRENLFGIDINPELISICKESFGPDGFSVCQPLPPTMFADHFFDFIVGYSVFSHLTENACDQWMKEYYRLLKPGGIAVMTTRGRWFIDWCDSLRSKPVEGYLRSLSQMFPDSTEAKARYDRGEFVHSSAYGLDGGGPCTADFYGETFIPEAYAMRAYLPKFRLARFLSVPCRHQQPMLFFVKQ